MKLSVDSAQQPTMLTPPRFPLPLPTEHTSIGPPVNQDYMSHANDHMNTHAYGLSSP